MRRRKPAAPLPNGASPAALAASWRADAGVLRHRGAEPLAASLESCAAELETWARAWELEALTLEQASVESGYSYSALQHMVAERRIKNVGTRHRPRIARHDLPRKANVAPVGQGLADRVLAARQRRPA